MLCCGSKSKKERMLFFFKIWEKISWLLYLHWHEDAGSKPGRKKGGASVISRRAGLNYEASLWRSFMHSMRAWSISEWMQAKMTKVTLHAEAVSDLLSLINNNMLHQPAAATRCALLESWLTRITPKLLPDWRWASFVLSVEVLWSCRQVEDSSLRGKRSAATT